MIRHYWSTTKHKAWVLAYILAFCAKLIWRARDSYEYTPPKD